MTVFLEAVSCAIVPIRLSEVDDQTFRLLLLFCGIACHNMKTPKLPTLHLESSFLPRYMECSRGIAMGILSLRASVRLSVRLSVKRVHCDKTEESYV